MLVTWWDANENCEAILGGQNAGFALFQYIGRGMGSQAGVNKMKKEEVFWDNESNKKGRKSC
jgi:hypothetical protein